MDNYAIMSEYLTKKLKSELFKAPTYTLLMYDQSGESSYNCTEPWVYGNFHTKNEFKKVFSKYLRDDSFLESMTSNDELNPQLSADYNGEINPEDIWYDSLSPYETPHECLLVSCEQCYEDNQHQYNTKWTFDELIDYFWNERAIEYGITYLIKEVSNR
jgi:hypothetical protein